MIWMLVWFPLVIGMVTAPISAMAYADEAACNARVRVLEVEGNGAFCVLVTRKYRELLGNDE